jgi:hypothetical protein
MTDCFIASLFANKKITDTCTNWVGPSYYEWNGERIVEILSKCRKYLKIKDEAPSRRGIPPHVLKRGRTATKLYVIKGNGTLLQWLNSTEFMN